MLHPMGTQMAVPTGTRVAGTDEFEDQKEAPLFLLYSITICV